MRKMKKLLSAFMCALSLTLVIPVGAVSVSAEETDVTKSLKNNSGLKYAAKQMNLFIETEFPSLDTSKKNNNPTVSDKVDIVCAAIAAAGGNGIDEDDMLRNKYVRVKDTKIRTMYKKIFGETVDLTKVKSKSKKLKIKKGKFYYLAGDFGEGIPSYSIESITKKSSTEYSMVITNDYKDYYTRVVYYSQGTTTVNLKKTNKKFYVQGYEYVPTKSHPSVSDNMYKYASVINNLRSDQSYSFAKLSDKTDALLVTDYTYRYENNVIAAIDAIVYSVDDSGNVVNCGKVSSAGTAYPLAVSKSGNCLYYGSGHSVNKVTLSDDLKSLKTVESASEEFDTSGKATYYYNGQKADNDSNLTRLFGEWLERSTIIEFIHKS